MSKVMKSLTVVRLASMFNRSYTYLATLKILAAAYWLYLLACRATSSLNAEK